MNTHKEKNPQVYLRDFFLWGYSQSGALLDVAQQNPDYTNWNNKIVQLV
jgi:hypothetical protein